MSDIVERVSAAISNTLTDNDGYLKKSYSDEDMHRVARAAIEAMREPTAAMSDAGEKYCDQTDPDVVWRIMINAALGSIDA